MGSSLYYVVTNFATAGVLVDSKGVVVEAAPIYKSFVGQPFDNLRRWNKVEYIEKVGKSNVRTYSPKRRNSL